MNLSFTNEYVNLPEKPFKALLSYGNITHVYWRCIRVSLEEYKQLPDTIRTWSYPLVFLAHKPLMEWNMAVPDPGDHRVHSVEVEMPSLPLGHYVIICASSPEFHNRKDVMALSTTQLSRISSIERRQNNGNQEFLVLDRETGAPMKGVKANVWNRVYEGNNWKLVLGETSTTGKDGLVGVTPPKNNNSSCSIEFVQGDDRLFCGQEFYPYRMGKPPKTKSLRTFFFIDRAVYRPGQTVYFKGIVLVKDGDKYEVAEKEKVTVRFLNVNSQETGHLDLTTNDFGSMHGSFVTPVSALNGEMSITDGHGEVYFAVEDYKLPKFFVQADTFKGTYRLGDSVTFSGCAKAYAGHAVGGAAVKYRITRTLRSSDVWHERRPWQGQRETEIKSGTTATNDTGGFSIAFLAAADPTISEKEDPLFVFTTSIDVTDITG